LIAVVSRIAGRQHGVVTRGQLLDADVTRHVIDGWLRTGQLKRLHRGVYLYGSLPHPFTTDMAAILACGTNACLSHRSAGFLWELLPRRRRVGPVEVTLIAGRRERPGVHTHIRRTLSHEEVTSYQRIPVTTPIRTLIDLAEILRTARLERAVAEAVATKLLTEAELASEADRLPRVRGIRRLRAVLGMGHVARTRSRAEERFLDLVRRAKLDEPRVNSVIAGHEVDFYWPTQHLAVEVDGRAFHSSRHSFESDRRRDAELVARGIRVVRITWRQLTREPEALLVRLGAALVAHKGGG